MRIPKDFVISLSLSKDTMVKVNSFLEQKLFLFILIFLICISVDYFLFFYWNGLGLAYNDARSHLDIARRVVEGLKPGIAQLGSVWLPLPHVLMIPFIWNDFLWHSGLAGAIPSMIAYVLTGVYIYKFLKVFNVGLIGRLVGVLVFALNLNVLYLQSTAMTELLLILSTTAASYYLVLWFNDDSIINLIKVAFWTMFASLIRYDGWFLFVMVILLSFFHIMNFFSRPKGSRFKQELINRYKKAEGILILFSTLGGLGVALWFLWNWLIFKDPLYFAFGPYSARAQQTQLEVAGNLITKGNLLLSIKTYFYALFYNSDTLISIISFFGALVLWFDKKIKTSLKVASLALWTPLIFNILALYFGHSVLFIQGINGDTWFNVRYGISLISSIAIFIAILIDRVVYLRVLLISLLVLISFFGYANFDAVTIDDARVGSSQKNVTEVSGWLGQNAKDKGGFILISAASHDAIIFSSGLPMKKFIHEGTGAYWKSATTSPDRWARWIVMRTYDDNDSTWKLVKATDGFAKYRLVEKFPFASIYELRDEYLKDLNTKPVLGRQK